MTRDDITRMAREAGFEYDPSDGNDIWITDGYWIKELERFAALVAAHEREECAKVCDVSARGWEMNPGNDTRAGFIAASNCAAAIRARGQK